MTWELKERLRSKMKNPGVPECLGFRLSRLLPLTPDLRLSLSVPRLGTETKYTACFLGTGKISRNC